VNAGVSDRQSGGWCTLPGTNLEAVLLQAIWRRPQLNVQAPDMGEFVEGSLSSIFENIRHYDTCDNEEALPHPFSSNRADMPVTRNK